jgi:hypothetical protein
VEWGERGSFALGQFETSCENAPFAFGCRSEESSEDFLNAKEWEVCR